MKNMGPQFFYLAAVVVAALAFAVIALAMPTSVKPPLAAARSALTVEVTTPQPAMVPLRLAANGNIVAWQEASIGAEANGLRVTEVNVNVGDTVRRGQVLASFAAATVGAELAQSRAAAAEAEAALAAADANARRARQLQSTGAMSAQQIEQYLTTGRAAQARVDALRAAEHTQQLRLAQTRVLAPDDGVISARGATVGAVPPAGQELFRLIRRGRLEWRAEVAAPDLAQLRPGQVALVTPAGGKPIKGTLRMIAPAIDMLSRNALVYVDLPPDSAARAGMFARGEFQTGSVRMVTLPQSAVLMRDGLSFVLRVGDDSRVVPTRVAVGRRAGDRIEVIDGIAAPARVVLAGGAFLGHGDLVTVTNDAPAPGGNAISN
jgi:RND family efflux transporter MFP subunit